MGLAGGVTLDRALNCCDSQFPFYESEDLTIHLWGLPGKWTEIMWVKTPTSGHSEKTQKVLLSLHFHFKKKKKKKNFQMMTKFKAVHWENMFSLNRENRKPRSPGTLTSTLYLNLILWQVTSLCAQKTCVARISPTSRVSFSMNHCSWGNSSTVFMGKAEALAEDSHGT